MPAHIPISNGIKYCPKCEKDLPVGAFADNKTAKHGKSSYCKRCHSTLSSEAYKNKRSEPVFKLKRYASKIKRQYGVSLNDYATLLTAQNGQCAICCASSYPRAHLDIDHNHDTKVIRGLLCRRCNNAIGLFRDNPKLATTAILYLYTNLCIPNPPHAPERVPAITRYKKVDLKRRFNMSQEQYTALWCAHDGKCGICYSLPKSARSLSIDHNHTTGVVRGLLCDRCNLAIGLFKDNPVIIQRFYDYLLR